MKLPTVKIGLKLYETRASGFYHFNAAFVRIGPDAYEIGAIARGETDIRPTPVTAVRNPDADRPMNGFLLGHLQIRSQADCGPDRIIAGRNLYAIDLTYREPYSVDRRKAELMARTLRTIGRRLERLDDRFGRLDSSDLAGYVGRVAAVTGATAIVYESDRSNRYTSSYDDMDLVHLDIPTGLTYIRQQIWKFQNELLPATVSR